MFARLQAIFPKWREIWQTDGEVQAAKREWVRVLVHRRVNSRELIKLGLTRASGMGWVRPPSAGQFAEWCIDGAREQAGIPSLEDTKRAMLAKLRGAEASQTGPLYQVSRYLDWWELRRADYPSASRQIEEAYQRMMAHWLSGAPWDMPPPAVEDATRRPRGPLTPELKAKGEAALAEIRAALSRTDESLPAPAGER